MGKLIFANSGSGKSVLIKKLKHKIIDTDIIQCKILNCEVNNLILKLKSLSSNDRTLHKIKVKMAIDRYKKSDYTVFTPTYEFIKYCDLAILQTDYDSIKLTDRENEYYLSEDTFKSKINDYVDSCINKAIPIIFLKPNQYLSDIIHLDDTKKIIIDGM